MKMQHKIVSMLLVLSLLLGSLIFTVSAEDEIIDDVFTPTAELEFLTNSSATNAAILYGGTSSTLGSYGFSQLGYGYTLYKGTRADGSDYLQLVSGDTATAGQNFQITLQPKASYDVAYVEGSSTYAVFDIDIATESSMTALAILPNLRDGNGSGLWGSSNADFTSIISLTPGEFAHITVIQDFSNNKEYIFKNNVLLHTTNLTSDTQMDNWKNGSINFRGGFKIQSDSTYGFTPIVEGQTSLFDNLQLNFYTDDAALASAISSGNLSSWGSAVYGSYDLPVVPDFIEIDGVKYNNTQDAAACLASSEPNNVRLIRDFHAAFNTGCLYDLVVRTNGCSYNFGASEVVDNGDGTVTVKCKLTETLNYSTITSVSSDLKNNVSDSTCTGIGLANLSTVNVIDANEIGSSDRYLGIYVPSDMTFNKINPYIQVNTANSYLDAVAGSTSAFYAIDFDVASHGHYIPYIDVSVMLRNKGTDGGFPFSDNINIGQYLEPSNTWSHVTIIGDLANNIVNVYIDGVYVGHGEDAVRSQNGLAYRPAQLNEGETMVTYKGIRIDVGLSNEVHTLTAGQNIMFDNFSQKTYADSTAAGDLVAANNAKNITAWSEYNSKRGGEELAPIASLNGEMYNNTAVLEQGIGTCVSEFKTSKIAFCQAPFGPINFYGVGVVDTNGIDIDSLVRLTADCETTENGNYVSIVAPTYTLTPVSNPASSSAIISDIRYNVSGNLFSTMQHVSYATLWNTSTGIQSALVTDAVTGNVYYKEYANDSKHIAGGNEYTNINYTSQTLSYVAGNNEYLVFDYDGAWESVSGTFIDTSDGNAEKNSGNLKQELIVRGAASGTSWNEQTFKNLGLTSNEFAHFTVIMDFTTANLYVFKNGSLTQTIANGALSAGAHENYLSGASGITASEFSIRSNSNDTLCLDNMAVRFYDLPSSSDDIATAVATGNITAWDGSIYNDSYVLPSLPAVGAVNGVPYTTENLLESAMADRGTLNVTLLKPPTEPLTVNGTAIVETNGFENAVEAGTDVTLVKQEGTVFYFESTTYKPSTTTSSATSFDNVTAAVGGNLLATSASEQNGGPYAYTKYVDHNSTDHYYMIQPIWDASTANTYINYGSTHYVIGANSYYIFDMDVATDSTFVDSLAVKLLLRYYPDASVTTSYKFGDSDGIKLANYLSPSDEWQHITVIGDINDNKAYVFVNGQYVGEAGKAASSGFTSDWLDTPDIDTDAFKFTGIRIDTSANVSLTKNQTTFFDNASVRFFANNAAACDIESYITNGSIADYPLATFGRMGTNLPAIATIDGVEYYNTEDASAALVDTSVYHTVYLDRYMPFSNITVSSESIVYLNGYNNVSVHPEFVGTVEGDNLLVTKDTSLCEVIVKINGNIVYTGNVECGTDFSKVLEDLGASGDSVTLGGKVYNNVKWDTNPGVVVNKVRIFEATADEATDSDAFYAYDAEGNVITPSSYDAAGFAKLLAENSSLTIVLNSDLVINCNNGIGKGDKTIILNGHHLTTPSTKNPNGDSHVFSFPNANAGSLTILGPGSINNPITWSQAFAFVAYGYEGTVTLKNLTVNTNQALFQLRSGNAVVENCEINAFSTNSNPTSLVSIGEDYNTGWTTTSINVSFKDSRINYKHLSGKTGAMITAKVVTAETDKRHTLVFDGCEIYAMSNFISYDYNASRGATLINSNLNVFLNDTTLVAGSLIKESGDAYLGTSAAKGVKYCAINATADKLIIIGSGVNVNEAVKTHIENLKVEGVIKTADGVELVKSNNHGASYTYSKNYATVTWEDETVEYWEHLSTPTNSAYPFAQVCTVAQGVSYKFVSSNDVNFSMKGNLTLGSTISFNIYIPDDVDIDSVSAFGNELEYTYRKIGGVLYKAYAIRLAPQDAAFAFDVVFKFTNGTSTSRTLSVTAYAEAMYAAGVSQEAKNMVYRMLEYIKAVNTYFGIKGENNVDSVLGTLSAATVNYTIQSSANNSALSGTITGAQLNISNTLKFRFNLASGVSATDVKVAIDGVEKTVEMHASYVEVDLYAYEMAKLLTVTVSGTSATYDLGAYCQKVIDGQGSTTTTELVYASLVESDLIEAIYNYAKAAEAYNSSVN